MRYGRNKTIQGSGDFRSKECQLCKGPNNVYVQKIMFKIEKMTMCTYTPQLLFLPTPLIGEANVRLQHQFSSKGVLNLNVIW